MASSSTAQLYRYLQTVGSPLGWLTVLALKRWCRGWRVESPDGFNGGGWDNIALMWVLSWVASVWKPEFPKALMPASEPLWWLPGSERDQEEMNLYKKFWYLVVEIERTSPEVSAVRLMCDRCWESRGVRPTFRPIGRLLTPRWNLPNPHPAWVCLSAHRFSHWNWPTWDFKPLRSLSSTTALQNVPLLCETSGLPLRKCPADLSYF